MAKSPAEKFEYDKGDTAKLNADKLKRIEDARREVAIAYKEEEAAREVHTEAKKAREQAVAALLAVIDDEQLTLPLGGEDVAS